MSRLILILGLVFAPAAIAQQQRPAAASGSPEQQIVQLERDWCQALLSGDAAVLERILADDYDGFSSSGGRSTKAEEVRDLRSGRSKMSTCTDTDVKVRVHGDAAVAIGEGIRTGVFGGTAMTNRRIHYTDTFVKMDGRWQCVASHATDLASAAKR